MVHERDVTLLAFSNVSASPAHHIRGISPAVEEDYRIGLIEDYLKDKDRVCIFELWKEALDNPNTKPTRKDSNEIALILQSMRDWERCPTAQRYGEYGVQMLWLKKSSSEEEFELLP